jgi:hypothetical protein
VVDKLLAYSEHNQNIIQDKKTKQKTTQKKPRNPPKKTQNKT